MAPMLTTVTDLRAAVRELRPDADPQTITADWCREQMHDLGVTRYENVDDAILGAIADRVDALVED